MTETDTPKEGDVVLDCGHPSPNGVHWFRGNFRFIRPDGTRGEATWVLQCRDCFIAGRTTIETFCINGDLTWEGPSPELEKPS